MMKLKLTKTRIQSLIAHRNGYLTLALGSLVLNVILTMALIAIFRTEKIILVPPEIERPMWVTNSHVSAEYLSSMSLYLTNLILNVTPTNADMQHQLFLRMVDSKHYEHIKTNLAIEAERLEHDHMTMHFNLSGIKVDADHLLSHISGDLEYKIGESNQPPKHLTYALSFAYQSGFLKLISFEEIKNEK